MGLSKIPDLPVVSTRGWRFSRSAGVYDSFARDPRSLAVSSGTAAIALALESAGTGPSHEVLFPALNCRSMREAAWVLQARDVLYRVNEDLGIDAADVARRITPATRALVVVHYFGFPQPLDELRRLCDRHGIALVEDCAHALFLYGRESDSPGDYLAGSATKFFPVMDGGFLVTRGEFRGPRLAAASAGRDLQSAWNAVQTAVEHDRLRGLAPFLKPVYAWRRRRKARQTPDRAAGDADGAGAGKLLYVDPAGYRRPMTRTSRGIVARYDLDAAADRRRRRYRRLARHCAGLAHCRPLFADLPDTVVPYMLPVLLERPAQDFARLKAGGMPMYRWEDCGESDCAVTARYREALVQFPCHERLSEAELLRIESLLSSVLG